MKPLILIQVDSLVDVITNSSSELFVCKTDKSLEFVNEFLADALSLYGRESGEDHNFDDCFDETTIIDESNVDQFINNFILGWDFQPYWLKVTDKIVSKWDFTEDTRYGTPEYFKKEEEYESYVADWIEKNKGIRDQLIGKIYIWSKSDNSIPYALFELIENTFNADRSHLG